MIRPYVIFGLPRSRTFWLSRFLTYGGWNCGHDELLHMRGLDDLKSWLSLPKQGTVETGAAPFWRTLKRMAPETRVVVVQRDPDRVFKSMMKLGIPFDEDVLMHEIVKLNHKLDQIKARWPGALSVTYSGLVSQDNCAEIFEYCIPYKHDFEWWNAMKAINLQVDLAAEIRYLHAHQPQLTKLAGMLKQQTLRDMALRSVVAPEGMTIEEEPFRQAWDGAQSIIKDHQVFVGEVPDGGIGKNQDMFQMLYDNGALQVMTARSNGRIFGYLMTTVTGSLESPDIKLAVHNSFYASPDVPGLGLKLQRAALNRLRDKGVNEVVWHAGVRGSGPRMGVLYKRLGAAPFGELYHMNMGA
jgi:hypothetical protein